MKRRTGKSACATWRLRLGRIRGDACWRDLRRIQRVRRLAYACGGLAGGRLAGLRRTGRCTERCTERRADLLATDANSQVLGRIPDELEEAIVLGFLEDHEAGLIDLAANADDAAAHDSWRIASGNGLRVCASAGASAGSRSAGGHPRRSSVGTCAESARGGYSGAWGGIRAEDARTGLPADRSRCGSGRLPDAACAGHLDIAQRLVEAADEVASGADVDESPGAVLFVHGVFVGLAHEADVADFGLGQVVE